MSKPKAAKVTHPKTPEKRVLYTHECKKKKAHTLLRGHGHATQKQHRDLHLKSYSGTLSARMGEWNILPCSLFNPFLPPIIILTETQQEEDKSEVEKVNKRVLSLYNP